MVEVLVAVGICAVTVVAVVGLYGPALVAVRETTDRQVASRLVQDVRAELRRAGFDSVAAATTGEPLRLTARATAGRVSPLGGDCAIPPAERHFLIEVSRAAKPESSAACLVLEVRVSWPFADGGDGRELPVEQRSQLTTQVGLNR